MRCIPLQDATVMTRQVRPHIVASDDPVYRTEDGERVFDEGDVPAILALAELAVLIERRWVRQIAVGELPSTAVSAHARDTGHRLAFGCCRARAG